MQRIEWANALRGIAALFVVIAHLAVMFWASPEIGYMLSRSQPLGLDGADPPFFTKALTIVPVAWGALGVTIFFLLSGYVIAISLDRYTRRGFLIGRLLRIIPTYAVGYLLACLVVAISGDPRSELSPIAILGGAIPGFPFVFQTPAIADGVVWTLVVEMVFYAVCLLVYRALTRHWWAIAAVAAACWALQFGYTMISTSIPSALLGFAFVIVLACPFLPLMLVGVTLSGYRAGRIGRVPTMILIPALTLTYWVLGTRSPVAPQAINYHVTVVVAVVAVCVIALFSPAWRKTRVLDFFADISYPLYVCHVVIGMAVLALLHRAGVYPALSLLVAVAIVVGVATALHYFVEMPTHRLGRRWAHRIEERTVTRSSVDSRAA